MSNDKKSACLVGVIGGMGPLATVDFMQQLIALAPAQCDQEHIAAMVAQIPQIPDRVGAILEQTASPFPQILASLKRLEQAGATLLVMPCNTAHYWHAALAAQTTLPFLHIVDAVLHALNARNVESTSRVGLLATPATLAAGVYQNHLQINTNWSFVAPPAQEVNALLVPAIALVKQGKLREAGERVKTCVQQLHADGIDHIVLGCTELPLALRATNVDLDDGYIDSTIALAQATIKHVFATKF